MKFLRESFGSLSWLAMCVLAMCVLTAMACGSSTPTDSSALSGGAPGSGGGAPSGSGGVAAGGTLGSGGSPSSGGGAASGGHASGGTSTGGAPSGGAASGGTGTGGGGGGGKPPPDPSAGCGKANPATGTSSQTLNVSNHDYYVKLPTNYDENTPYPVLMMFHPTGNPITWAEQNSGYESTAAKDDAIRVYPASLSNSSGWVAGDVPFFEPFYQKILDDYCVDQERVFAAGESSGGDFVSILGCEHADKVRAIAPCATKNVPEYQLNAGARDCSGQVAAIVIHGTMDNQVGTTNGPLTRDFYRELNHCTDVSDPVDGYTDSMSNCVLFQGCDDGFPVYWCNHNDPEYGGTNHGWPHFAAEMTWATFADY